MATKGFFTFDDLYLGRGKEYLYKKSLYETTSSVRTNSRWFPSYSVDEDLSPSFFDGQEESLVDTMKSTTTAATLNLNFVDKLEKINTFAYLYWFLIALAVALTLLLMVVITYYCCHHCQRKRKQRK